ncbi:MAG: orotate phosphoribosyltransferase [Planctomycetaceae bacterium]
MTMVEDVVTSGGQIILSHRDLVESGANVDQAICVIDRQAGGLDKLKTAGIELKSLFKKIRLDTSLVFLRDLTYLAASILLQLPSRSTQFYPANLLAESFAESGTG